MRILSVDLNKDYNGAVLEAVAVLRNGGVVVYPTDTVYGLGANACDHNAAEQIFKIKNRPLEKPLPVIARNIDWVREIAFVPPKLEKLLFELWPGAVTAVLPRKNVIPPIVTAGLPNVGVRIADYFLTDKLLGKFGYPLTATSANLSGEATSGDIDMIIEMFKDKVWKPDLILNAGVLPESKPSTVIDFSTIKPKILRTGALKTENLMKLLDI